MADYIERQAAVSRFEQLKEQADTLRDRLYLDGVLAIIDKLPSSHVRKDVRGEWEEIHHMVITQIHSNKPNYEEVNYRCSVCGRMEPNREPFCPNCGADMRGKPDGTYNH